jgi:gliding motility-associated-like protein
MLKKILFSLSILFSITGVIAQVKINEYSTSNSGLTILDNTGKNSDWIELYNSGAISEDIAGWELSDDQANTTKYSFPAGTIIAPSSFLRIWCSGKGSSADAAGHIHTNFKLTQCQGDWIVLSNGIIIVDSLQLKRTQANHSRGRKPDGAAIWNVFTSPTPNSSNSTTGYSSYAPTPVMNVPPGFYSGTKLVSLSVTPSNSLTIYYTTDGSEPTTGSSIFLSTPVSISTTSVLRGYSVSSDANILPSFMETNTYFINETINAYYGVVSISGGMGLDSLLDKNQIKPRTHLEYFENQSFKTEGYGTANKHGNDSWNYSQRGIDVQTFDEYGYNNAYKNQFFVDAKMGASPRKEFQHIILKAAASDNFPGDKPLKACQMRDAFVQTYAFQKGLDVDGRRNKHTIVFKNGVYWGIYELREPFEGDYTDYYYKQPSDSIDNLAYWGSLQIRNGSDTAWVNLYNFIMGNSMTNVANYAYVDSKLSFKSLVDYMIYNSYVVNSDFINWNTAWWRGRATQGDKKKWRYWMWDMDNVYDLGENYSGIPTTGMNASPCAYTNTFQNAGPNMGHPDILEKLLTNPDFKAFYINRYADLMNTALKCDKIMEHFNYFKTILTPEMPRHIAKWGGTSTLAQWNQNMDTLQYKIQQRCSYIDSVITTCYNVSGPYNLTVDVDPPGAGNVKLNSIWLNNFLWSGKYFGGVKMTFKETVSDTALYEFDRWEFKNHLVSPSLLNDSVSIKLTTNDNVIAHYIEKTKDVVFPTAFTPNGDGRNDILVPLGTRNVKTMSFEIWNRWGQLIFSSTDPTKGWDGNYQGSPSQTGVYAYLIKYTATSGIEKIIKGNVTLIR